MLRSRHSLEFEYADEALVSQTCKPQHVGSVWSHAADTMKRNMTRTARVQSGSVLAAAMLQPCTVRKETFSVLGKTGRWPERLERPTSNVYGFEGRGGWVEAEPTKDRFSIGVAPVIPGGSPSIPS
jgi:hypothetical protein